MKTNIIEIIDELDYLLAMARVKQALARRKYQQQ
jgi:hypothetical protein